MWNFKVFCNNFQLFSKIIRFFLPLLAFLGRNFTRNNVCLDRGQNFFVAIVFKDFIENAQVNNISLRTDLQCFEWILVIEHWRLVLFNQNVFQVFYFTAKLTIKGFSKMAQIYNIVLTTVVRYICRWVCFCFKTHPIDLIHSNP